MQTRYVTYPYVQTHTKRQIMKHTLPQIKYRPGTESLAAELNEKIAKLVREHPQDLVALKKAIDARNSLILI